MIVKFFLFQFSKRIQWQINDVPTKACAFSIVLTSSNVTMALALFLQIKTLDKIRNQISSYIEINRIKIFIFFRIIYIQKNNDIAGRTVGTNDITQQKTAIVCQSSIDLL